MVYSMFILIFAIPHQFFLLRRGLMRPIVPKIFSKKNFHCDFFFIRSVSSYSPKIHGHKNTVGKDSSLLWMRHSLAFQIT